MAKSEGQEGHDRVDENNSVKKWIFASFKPAFKNIGHEVAKIANSARLVIFSKTGCPYCGKAKDLFQSILNDGFSEIKIVEIDKGTANNTSDALFILSGRRTVPNVFLLGKSIGGFDDIKGLHDEGKLLPILRQAGMIPIQVGEAIPSATVQFVEWSADSLSWKVSQIDAADFFRGKKVVLFGVPAAFSPACSDFHLPGYVEAFAGIVGAGVDEVVCVAANDAFVLRAWATQAKAGGKVTMLADGNGQLLRKMGLISDASGAGMGWRGRRFAMLISDGQVRHVAVDRPRQVEVSTAAAILPQLSRL